MSNESHGEGWWLASDGNWYPPGHEAPQEHGEDGRPRRRWPWIVGAAAVVSAAGIALFLALDETVLTHDLLDADFDSGAFPFVEDEIDEYVLETVDGEYKISTKTDAPSAPAFAFAWFARTAWTLEAEVTVVQASDSPTVGIGCLRAADGEPVLEGFIFAVGQGSAVLWDYAGDDSVTIDRPKVEPGQRIGINCQSEMATVNRPVQGIIEDEQVLELSNDHSEGFDRVVLFFFPTGADDFAVFDNVRAQVP